MFASPDTFRTIPGLGVFRGMIDITFIDGFVPDAGEGLALIDALGKRGFRRRAVFDRRSAARTFVH
jgi:hypothetical protein